MAKYTCEFKHKIILQYIAKPDQRVYFTFSRGVFRTLSNVRSSRLEMFCRKSVLRNFAEFTGKHLCQSLLFNKEETLALVFSCEFCELFKSTFFTEHLRWLLLKRLSKRLVSLEVTVFTKNFILDV